MKFELSKKIKITTLIISSIIIGIFLASFLIKNINFKTITTNAENKALAIEGYPIYTEENIPQLAYFAKDQYLKPTVSAEAYVVGDLDTGEIILKKNEDMRFPLASVSKLMTALTAKELMNTDDTVKISQKILTTSGNNGNLKINEKIKISTLIYPLLLESSNDAAEAIAQYFDRNIFIKRMNQNSLKLNLEKTSFEDPSGLSANNQSTALDMFKLAGYIKLKNPDIFEITTKRNYSEKKHTWFNISQFLRKENYTGGKSGFTYPALQTVISTFSLPLSKTGTRHISISLLRSKDRLKDVENILKYLNKNIYYGGASDASVAWVKERTDLPIIYDQDYVNLTFVGDMMLDRGVESSVNKNFNGDFSFLFEKLTLLKKSDISFANLEGPASDKGKDMRNLYSFRMDPSVIPAIKGAGFDIMSVANNHMGDWKREAFADTLSRLEENEIFYTGGGINNTEAERPVIIEKYGIKIGYLGFSDVGPNWMKATEESAGILLANNPRFEEIINNASKLVDHLIVSFHFGDEYKTIHNKRQEYLAHKAIDSGAKIVVGHHPHVVEDTEIYKDGYIMYSLGNFIFDQGFSKNTMEGMIVEIKLDKDGGMTVKKNISKLNKLFKIEKIINGKEEKLKFK
ncbi:MAG: CapA family protein [Burkholderiales bacterium]|nr:CapA family protein [Burkholderiales bacterium]